MIQDTNGGFYGTTEKGGTTDGGTVFSLSVGLGPFVATQTTSTVPTGATTGTVEVIKLGGMPLLHCDRDFGLIAGVEPKLMLVAAGK